MVFIPDGISDVGVHVQSKGYYFYRLLTWWVLA